MARRFVNQQNYSEPAKMPDASETNAMNLCMDAAVEELCYEHRGAYDSSKVAPVQQMRSIDAIKNIIKSFDVHDGSYKLTDVDMILLENIVNNCDEEMCDQNGRPWADWDLYYDVMGNPLEPQTFVEGPYTITLPPETEEQLETIRNWQLFCEEQNRLLGGRREEIRGTGGYEAVEAEVARVKSDPKLMQYNIQRYEYQQKLIEDRTKEFEVLKEELKRKYREYKARETASDIQDVLIDDFDRYGDMWNKPYVFRNVLDTMKYEEVQQMLLAGEKDIMYQLFRYFGAEVRADRRAQNDERCRSQLSKLQTSEWYELEKAVDISHKVLENKDENIKDLSDEDIQIIQDKLWTLEDALMDASLSSIGYVQLMRHWLISMEPVRRLLEQKNLISINYNIVNEDYQNMKNNNIKKEEGGKIMIFNPNAANSNTNTDIFNNNNSGSNNSSGGLFNNNNSGRDWSLGGNGSTSLFSSNNSAIKWQVVEDLLKLLWENRRFVGCMSDYTYNTAWKDLITAVHKKDRKVLPNILKALIDRASQDGSIREVDGKIFTQLLAEVNPQQASTDGSKYSDDYSGYQNVTTNYSQYNGNGNGNNCRSGSNGNSSIFNFNNNYDSKNDGYNDGGGSNTNSSNIFHFRDDRNTGGGTPHARFVMDDNNDGYGTFHRRPGSSN